MSSVNNVKTSYLKFMLTLTIFFFFIVLKGCISFIYINLSTFWEKKNIFTTSLWNHEPKCLLNFMFSCPLRFQLWLVHFSGSICIFYSFKSLCFSNTFTVLCSSPENPSVTLNKNQLAKKVTKEKKYMVSIVFHLQVGNKVYRGLDINDR